MARYRVTSRMFINNTIIDPDTMPEERCIVEYDGIPGKTLQLIPDEESEVKKPKTKAKTDAA
jgi:hypothetical protein